MYNATPPQWHGGGAQSRLFEVTPAPDTTYYIGRAAPQGGAQGWAADLPGGEHEVFIPRDTDRTDWTVRAVGRSEAEARRCSLREVWLDTTRSATSS